MYSACGKEAVKLESVYTRRIVQTAMLHEYVGNLIRSLAAYLARRDVGFGEFCFEERSEEEKNRGVIVDTAVVSLSLINS
jgi:hypothetical protein